MKKIKEYKLVAEPDIKWLDQRVNSLIKCGYQPMGAPQITIHTCENKDLIIYYSQVMVIYEEDSEQKE